MCTACKTLGHTARDVTKYHCGDCNRNLGHTRFDKDTLKNSKNRGCTLRCIECNNKCKCIVCGLRFEKNKAKINEICYNCQQNGYSMMHTKTYTCTKCKMHAGYRKFKRTSNFYCRYLNTPHEEERLMCVECHKQKTKAQSCNTKMTQKHKWWNKQMWIVFHKAPTVRTMATILVMTQWLNARRQLHLNRSNNQWKMFNIQHYVQTGSKPCADV